MGHLKLNPFAIYSKSKSHRMVPYQVTSQSVLTPKASRFFQSLQMMINLLEITR